MYLFVKRILDVIFASILLIMFMPVFIIISIAIKLNSKGPVLFKQVRSGKYAKEFTLYKFRSMTHGNDVYQINKKNEVTSVGKILRSTSLDELPQIINILKGDMSFIGPRPWIIDYQRYFTMKQIRRLRIKPGITGLAQAKGRNSLNINDKINYDINYVNNMSLILDIKIIIWTIMTIFKTEDIDISKLGIKSEIDFLKKNYKKEYKINSI